MRQGTRNLKHVLVAGCAALALASCADGEAAEQISEGLDVVDATAAPGGTAADPGVVDVATGQACSMERSTLEQVLETYTLLKGAPPAAETDLIPDYLREESVLFDISPEGQLVAAPGSGCT